MEKLLYNYLYNSNHFIKHSGINRLTPFEKLKEFYNKKDIDLTFTKSLNEFINYEKHFIGGS